MLNSSWVKTAGSRFLRSATALAVLFTAACGQDTTGPAAMEAGGGPSFVVGDTWEVDHLNVIPDGKVFVCTFESTLGNDFFSTTFTSTASGGDLISSPFTLSMPPDCLEIWNATSAGTENVTVTFQSAPGYTLDRVAVMTGTTDNATFLPDGSTSATVAPSGSLGAMIWFKLVPGDEPPPEGGQGCTPGYWKQTQHFGNWTAPYTPSTLFGAVFDDAFPGKTLLDVLSQGGGGLNALGRMTVAALLNGASAGVEFDYSAAEVIQLFNDVYPGTGTQYETLKNRLDFLNNQGCPLGAAY